MRLSKCDLSEKLEGLSCQKSVYKRAEASLGEFQKGLGMTCSGARWSAIRRVARSEASVVFIPHAVSDQALPNSCLSALSN